MKVKQQFCVQHLPKIDRYYLLLMNGKFIAIPIPMNEIYRDTKKELWATYKTFCNQLTAPI